MTGAPPRLASLVPRSLFERRLSTSLWAVSRVWLGIAICWWIVGSIDSVWMVLPAAAAIGVLQYHLNILGHDGIHFLLCDNRRVNDFICRWFLHGPHGAPLGEMRANHLNHHMAFGAEDDHDRQYYDVVRFRGDAKKFRRWLWLSLFGGMTLPIIAKLLRAQTASFAGRSAVAPSAGRGLDMASVGVSQIWIACAAFACTGWWHAYLWLWVVPLFTVMVGLNTIRSCLEHADPRSPTPTLRSFVSNPVESFFLSPFNMCIHAEHHLVPAVPWHQLPRLRHFLQTNGLCDDVLVSISYRVRYREIAADLGGWPRRPTRV